MGSPLKSIDRSCEPQKHPDDYYISDEQTDTWFLGSIMLRKRDFKKKYKRISLLHNRITHEHTNFDERYQANNRIASQLSEFFPKRWLLEITATFKKLSSKEIGLTSEYDRICSYLGFIELYLTFRGLTLLESTIDEINKSLYTNLSKNDIRKWKIKLLRIIPELRANWKKIRAPTHQTAIISSVVQIMNQELSLTNCSQQEIFEIKQSALTIARIFALKPKAKFIKNIETWARAICIKALQECKPKYPCLAFPRLSQKTLKVIENKRWQLDKLLD
ncbi:MAG: hypothetical protein ACW964_01360 [Candidatus Hodarchaeales archaeon]